MVKDFIVERFGWDDIVNKDKIVILTEELLENIREQDLADIDDVEADAAFMIMASLEETTDGLVYRTKDGKLICIVGLCKRSFEAVGRCIWMMGTKELYSMKYKKSVLVADLPKVMNGWIDEYGLLFGCVNRKNTKSIRWLKWMGAQFLEKQAEKANSRIVDFYIH